MTVADWIKAVLVGGVLATYAAIIIGLFTWTIPADNRDIAYMVVGGHTALMATIINYFFGSAQSSHKKDDTINDAVEALKLAGKGTP